MFDVGVDIEKWRQSPLLFTMSLPYGLKLTVTGKLPRS